MSLDIEKYRSLLAGYHLSEEEETELIQSVWTMLEGFVDHAYGRHPHQRCGMMLEQTNLQMPTDSLESPESHSIHTIQAIGNETLKQ